MNSEPDTYWNIFLLSDDKLDIRFIVCIYPTPSLQVDTSSIFKLSTTDLNSGVSISSTSCPTKIKEPSLLYCLFIAGERIVGITRVLHLSVDGHLWWCNS